MKKIYLFIILLNVTFCLAQPNRFQKEVEELSAKYDSLLIDKTNTIVFTGSSSIRMWHDLKQRFPTKTLSIPVWRFHYSRFTTVFR